MTNKRAPIHATAQLRGNYLAPRLGGSATFTQKHNGVLVTVRVIGLPLDSPTGFFALHVHEGASCSGEDFSRTLGHYDPQRAPHPRHAGDLPPLISCGGEGYLCVLTDRFTVREILGRTLVIHSGPDDFRSAPSGMAGAKIACGEIRRASRR